MFSLIDAFALVTSSLVTFDDHRGGDGRLWQSPIAGGIGRPKRVHRCSWMLLRRRPLSLIPDQQARLPLTPACLGVSVCVPNHSSRLPDAFIRTTLKPTWVPGQRRIQPTACTGSCILPSCS